VVFVTGVILLFVGPRHRGSLVSIHKVSFIVWLVFTGLHVLGHLPRLGKSLRVARENAQGPGPSPGSVGRVIVLAGALVGGLVLALVLIPDYHLWTAAGSFPHHHEH
jgi:hypothetical protein